MADAIKVDDVLGIEPPARSAPPTQKKRAITAQDVIDFIPVDPALQPQLVYERGQPYNALDLEYVNSPHQIPKLRVEQRPTGPDQNVLPGNAGFGANFKANFVEDQNRKISYYAKALFPNDPNAARRFGVRNGSIVYLDDEGNIRDVEHGFGSRAGTMLAYTPETVGAIVGSFASGNPVTGGAIGGAGGKGIKQIIAGAFMDDPQTPMQNLKGMAGEGLLNFIAGGAGKGVSKFFNKGKVVDFTPAQMAEAHAAAAEIEKRLGIKLDLSQSSQDPVLMALRKYAAKFPGKSAQIFKQLDETQTGQTADAMAALMDKVAKATASEYGGIQGINAASKAIRNARSAVSAEVKPLYDKAYAAVPEVKDQKILDMLKLPHFAQAYKSGQRIATLEGTATDVPGLRAMDYTKRALDDKIETLMSAGKRNEARVLKAKRDEFVAALDAIPNQEWQAARQAYGKLAKERIEPLENGAIGVLANTENRRAARVAAKMMTDPNITPNEIGFARAAIENADPEAWGHLTRQYLATTLNNALKVTQKGESVNLAGKLYQSLAGTPEQLAKLRAALPKDVQPHLNDVLGAFKMIAATERVGSDTAFNQLVTKKIEGRFSTALKMARQPWQTVIEAGDQKHLEGMVMKLAEGLTDPAKVAQLRQVSKAPPSLNRALQIISILGVTPPERMLRNELYPMADTPIGEPSRGRYRPRGSQSQ